MAYDTSHLLTVGHAKTVYDNLKSAFPVKPSNAAFLDAEVVNLWDGSYIDGYALTGNGTAPSTQTYAANAARYNMIIVPIQPYTTYTVCGKLTDGSTGFCKVMTATKLVTAGSKLDGSYGYGTTESSFVCTFTTDANDKYVYIYGYQSTTNSRAYMYQVREGVWSGFTTNEVGLTVGTTNDQISVRHDDVGFLDAHNINICDGIPIDGLALSGNGADDQHLTANSARYNLYVMRCKPNTTYTVIAEVTDNVTPNMLKIKTATHKFGIGDNMDGGVYIGIGSVSPKERTQFTTGRNDRWMYIYGLHYQSNSRAHFLQVCEGDIPDFTTDQYDDVYGTPNDKLRMNAPVRIVPVSSTSFQVYVLDSASRRYFRHDFIRQNYDAQLPYEDENPSTVVCADVWYSNSVYDPDGNKIMQGNTNFIHYVSNKGDSHIGHVGASHGCAVATWTQFWADGRQFDPSTLESPIECDTFRLVEKVVHYLNDITTSKALYPTTWSTHAIPTLDDGGDPIITGIEYLDGTWEINNKVTVRNRFDVVIDDVQFEQMYAAMLCGFIPYMYDVQIESPDWLWTHVNVEDDTYTAVDRSGTGTVIPVGDTTPYMGYTATLFGDKVRATKTMLTRDPARYGKSNILMWMPPNDDDRLKAYFQPCITTESPEGETVETFGTGDIIDTVSVLKIDWAG